MTYDAAVIGAGLAGLAAASLLSKRGLKVAVIEQGTSPGGSCGIFKRNGAIFDQGSAMLYGFGERGFNTHRFVFNCLEEPIDMIRHELLYTVNFKGHRIRFFPDVEKFAEELSLVFPNERQNIHRFYRDMEKLYRHVMVENPTYNTPDETSPATGLKGLLSHPLSYIRFLSYLNQSAQTLLRRYFKDPEIFKFFDKLTSTYCYATVKEAPAILAAVMFVDNHVGGSYYPAGSTLFVPGKLEKVIEENGGDMFYGREALQIHFKDGKPAGVKISGDEIILADDIVYSGTVWNFYAKLIPQEFASSERIAWAAAQKPTYPSVVLYAIVDRDIIPQGTQPVEMLVGNPDEIDESEVTAYIQSIDDHTLCGNDEHVVAAIGPSFEQWEGLEPQQYKDLKLKEQQRLLGVLEKRFAGIKNHVRYAQVATPRTIERYCFKNGGAVAGPKQMLGQHMFKRLHTRSEWDNLFCCGESTVMGTGTPTVTTSGLSAANLILTKHKLSPFVYKKDMKNYVNILIPPTEEGDAYKKVSQKDLTLMKMASACQYCEEPACCAGTSLDVPGLMRRASVANFFGARKILRNAPDSALLKAFEDKCIEKERIGRAVQIREITERLLKTEVEHE